LTRALIDPNVIQFERGVAVCWLCVYLGAGMVIVVVVVVIAWETQPGSASREHCTAPGVE
jgi:hypothetical protein